MSVVPRWLELTQEIDCLYFLLEEERRHLPRSPIDKAVDTATGADVARARRCREIAIEMKKLKAEWSKETGREADTEMEDAILAVTEQTEPTP